MTISSQIDNKSLQKTADAAEQLVILNKEAGKQTKLLIALIIIITILTLIIVIPIVIELINFFNKSN